MAPVLPRQPGDDERLLAEANRDLLAFSLRQRAALRNEASAIERGHPLSTAAKPEAVSPETQLKKNLALLEKITPS